MKIKALSLLIFMACSPLLMAQSGMTDQQVLEYAKDGVKQGKDQRTIATELARRGVTREQAERVKKLYEQQTNTDSNNLTGTAKAEARLREQVQEDNSTMLDEKPQAQEVAQQDAVFGRNIFNTRNLTFEPNVNIATPPNYRLGPGDEVVIDIWGASQNTIRQQISPDGTINLEQLGPVFLSGMTVDRAQQYLTDELRKIYSDQSNQIRVTLGNTRTIQINVMGEVVQPGTYALSAFSTVFHALYRAGGVSNIGSLRNVKVSRGGKIVATVDVYQFIMQGKTRDDIRLEEGDVIIVPAYDALVQITGNVKRPMRYEMKKGETLSTLLKYAGGFTSDAYTKSLRIVRQNGKEYQVNTVDDTDYSVCKMHDGDVVTAEAILDRFTNKLEVRGAVYRPGIYELGGKLNTVRELVEKADGLMADAFTGRAVLYRERENKTREVKQIDIRAIMDGTQPDIPLQKNDVLYIPSIHDLEDLGNVQIYGEVAHPGDYPYADNMTLEDLVITAGGLRESASVVRVDVARRIKDPKSTESSATIGQTFSFGLKDGFVVDGEPGFTLQPYDQVFVRRSPGYSAQQNVTVSGEVLYGGTYALTTKSERISSVIAKAGGATPFAYVKGAKLTRVANEEEIRRMQDVVTLLRRQVGDAMIDSLGINVQNTFTVGIDLEEALANPGSDADIVLREGDVITVPEYNNTVKIDGAVMMPNTVSFKKGESVKYYISQAGGYGQNAKKSKKFIIYMNGQIAEVKGSGKSQIEPGCEIIVPSKRKKQFNIGNLVGLTSSVASLATLATAITALVK
ncbi:SLBB domain-containing protein [uncultured Bacteroides sp.]|uniref:SLBB domain-containing protein n=1 Tax=uncultured Bacteroides sp. TaxID=162156 RepID=UPI002665A514|nr:SLBB domain-containing protein [uncultured Bacteroides sp.]